MTDINIGFIGGGNMASSLIGGLIAGGKSPSSLFVSEPDSDRLKRLAERFGIQAAQSNEEIVAQCDCVVLAVKPQQMASVALELQSALKENSPLIVSVAAGIKTEALARWLGEQTHIVRAMPNTPALVGAGATALYANSLVSDAEKNLAEGIIRAVGVCLWIEQEAQMDVVTALSGSGPAYFFLLMELMQKSATELGLPAETARMLTLETALGAAKLALEQDCEIAELRAMVTSPGGTTERAINIMLAGGLEGVVHQALTGAAHRSEELAEEFGA